MRIFQRTPHGTRGAKYEFVRLVLTSICASLFASAAACGPAEPLDEASSQAVEVTEEFSLSVDPALAAQVDEPELRREITAAIDLYRREVAAPKSIRVAVGAAECLRTGYSAKTNTVAFCNNRDTPRVGTASTDVIHHEVFHALLCRSQPDWCTPAAFDDTAKSALHEGLADFFAHELDPDASFGEGFYADRPVVRTYRTPLCYSLVDGAHEKGNAIASALLAQKKTLADVARLVRGGELTVEALFGASPEDSCLGGSAPSVSFAIGGGYELSTLNRYRIEEGKPLDVDFAADDAFAKRFGALTVRWAQTPQLFTIAPRDEAAFRVERKSGVETGFDKVVAQYVADGEVVGTKPFYFQVARP